MQNHAANLALCADFNAFTELMFNFALQLRRATFT